MEKVLEMLSPSLWRHAASKLETKGKCEENVACYMGFYWECLRKGDGRGCEKHVDRIKHNKMASEL